jgi:hypothetical protein
MRGTYDPVVIVYNGLRTKRITAAAVVATQTNLYHLAAAGSVYRVNSSNCYVTDLSPAAAVVARLHFPCGLDL